MTAIATDGKSMAGDTLGTCKGFLMSRKKKVHKLSDGRIVGASGPTTECQMLVRWIAEGGDKPSLGEDVSALILNPDGTVDWVDNKFEILENQELPAAIGCGCDLAVGAMLAGATPYEAVMLVATRQLDVGGDITVEEIDEPRKLRRVA